MLKKVLFIISALLLAGGLLGAALIRAEARAMEGPCPPGHVLIALLDPILPGEQGSKIVEQDCRPAAEYAAEYESVGLEPLRPEDMEIPEPRPTGISPIVRGPSDFPEYRCVVVLEPIREGEEFSEASEPVCGSGLIDSVNGVSLESLYLIAKFYDNTNYGSLLREYYGQYPCSAGYSYGRPDLRVDGVDNRFASGQGFSTCNLITVYDLYNYSGPSYACGPNCPTFYALDDKVSSWKITY
jgi:hypothetical protein